MEVRAKRLWQHISREDCPVSTLLTGDATPDNAPRAIRCVFLSTHGDTRTGGITLVIGASHSMHQGIFPSALRVDATD